MQEFGERRPRRGSLRFRISAAIVFTLSAVSGLIALAGLILHFLG